MSSRGGKEKGLLLKESSFFISSGLSNKGVYEIMLNIEADY